MNWHYIINEILLSFLKAAIIFGSYYMSKWFFINSRKNDKRKASIFGIIWVGIEIIFINTIIIGIFSSALDKNKLFVYFSIMVIPSIFGLIDAAKHDAKLRPEEREK